MPGDVHRTGRRTSRQQVRAGRMIRRSAERGPNPVALRPAPDERRGPGRPRVGPVSPVGQTHSPVREGVEVGGQAAPAEIADAVRPHRPNRCAALVDHGETQAGDRQRPLEQVEGGPAVALRPSDRRRAHTGGFRQLPLAEIGAAAGPPQRAGHVEASGHAPSFEGPQRLR